MQADIWTGKLCYERGRFETDSVLVNRHHNDERPVLDQVVLSLVWTCRILHATLSAISFFQYRFALGDLPETTRSYYITNKLVHTAHYGIHDARDLLWQGDFHLVCESLGASVLDV
jgi:hypothetical protein